MLQRILLSVTVAAFCVGCAATSPSVVVLLRGGASMPKFQADEAACQPYAEAKSKAADDAAGWQSFGRQPTAGLSSAALGAFITAFSGEGAELTGQPAGRRPPGTYQAERCTLVSVS